MTPIFVGSCLLQDDAAMRAPKRPSTKTLGFVRLRRTVAGVVIFIHLWTSVNSHADQVPTVDELRTQVLRPRRQLEYGSYLLTVAEEQGGRRTDIRVRFLGDCVRKDSYAPADRIQRVGRDGQPVPFQSDGTVDSVFIESFCNGVMLDYNPVKEVHGQLFAIGVRRIADEPDPKRAEAEIRQRFFNPRLIGIEPAQVGHLHRVSFENILYDDIATSGTVQQVTLNGVACLLLEQTLNRGQSVKQWIRDDAGHAVCAAEISNRHKGQLIGTKVEIDLQSVEAPSGPLDFPRTIKVYDIRDEDVKLMFVEEISDVDFRTNVDAEVFTVKGLEARNGTHVHSTKGPEQVVQNGETVPWRPDNIPPRPRAKPPGGSPGRYLQILALNCVVVAVWVTIAYRSRRKRKG